MELSEHGFLEELLAPRREMGWPNFPPGMTDEFLPPWWNSDSSLAENASLVLMSDPVGISEQPAYSEIECPTFAEPYYYHLLDEFVGVPSLHAPQLDYPPVVEDEEIQETMKAEINVDTPLTNFDVGMGYCAEKKVMIDGNGSSSGGGGSAGGGNTSTAKKSEGQPSKNLMAERRRRKRLNDRLSMLRSIVPKISKMDRTSILGDTIDYMKELLERINKLQQEQQEEIQTETTAVAHGPLDLTGVRKNNEVLVRNSPKFNVERRESETRIDICCTTKPGLLLSTMNTLEALGLELHQCVVSCFSDFSMQASCSEGVERSALPSPEDIKQALFRNAGYGGRCA